MARSTDWFVDLVMRIQTHRGSFFSGFHLFSKFWELEGAMLLRRHTYLKVEAAVLLLESKE